MINEFGKEQLIWEFNNVIKGQIVFLPDGRVGVAIDHNRVVQINVAPSVNPFMLKYDITNMICVEKI